MMVVTTGSPIQKATEAWIGSGASEALLVEQLAHATRELRTREAEGGGTDGIRPVIRSLRRTLTFIAERGGVQDFSGAEFAVRCPGPESLELWHRGRKVSADVPLLRQTLRTAGVRLQSGQVLLADREWVRQSIEESLLELSLEELRIRQEKTSLLRALHDVPGTTESATGRDPWPAERYR